MKIITVLVGDVLAFPPVLNLLNAFESLNIESVLITTKSKNNIKQNYPKTIIHEFMGNYEEIQYPLKKMVMIPIMAKKIWTIINKYYDDSTIIWIVTDVTIKILGNKLLTKRYILHLMELSEKIYYYHRIKFIKMNEKKIGGNALAVVVPEYNRAQITKTWWKLKKMPYILPNKPFVTNVYSKHSNIDDLAAQSIFSKIGDRKILLYQGIMNSERPLDKFIEAVDDFGGKYAFVIMSGGKDLYENCGSDNYYFIPFVTPPMHLQITSNAYIGVLSYVPTDSNAYSPLNALYCAPNKTFEFSMFGIPMIGNDIPGLKFLFETRKNGLCFESYTKEAICEVIKKIEKNYDELSQNAHTYYDSCDYKKIVKGIIEEVYYNGR